MTVKDKSSYAPSGMKRLGVFLLLPGWDASPSQGYPPPSQPVPRDLGGKRHCESKVSCLRTLYKVPGQVSNPDRSIRRRPH